MSAPDLRAAWQRIVTERQLDVPQLLWAAREIERLQAQADQFHHDYGTLLVECMYGNPPGGWSDPERIAEFHRESRDAEARHRAYAEQKAQGT